MFKSFFKYFSVLFISLIIFSIFPNTFSQLRLVPKGIVKYFFPEKKNIPTINSKESYKDSIEGTNDNKKAKSLELIETINANSFQLNIEKIKYFSGYNRDQDGKQNSQHKSAGFFGFKKKNKTILELYTRDGFLISEEGIKQFNLPKSYDSHNSQGGIRGIFYFNSERYAYLATLKIGCQNMSIFNLDRNIEIFDTDCLPDYEGVHFDGVGGASVHDGEKILLSIGAPTNNSQSIRELAQKDNSYFGKIISIEKTSLKNFLENKGKIKIKKFTKGHRNPQGLAKLGNNFFSAEHGPKGGDEINLLIQGYNYGWPIVSYGTKYESVAIASYKLNHSKQNFEEPLIQFTPSIAISDLTNCTNELKKYYNRNGCLIGTMLRDQGLILILLDENLKRVIGYEKIDFGERLRHLAKQENGELFQEKDGSIYVTSDSGEVLKVSFRLIKE